MPTNNAKLRLKMLPSTQIAVGGPNGVHGVIIPDDILADVAEVLSELSTLSTRVTVLEEALQAAYKFHQVVECISEQREECSCQSFDSVRDALLILRKRDE